MVSSTVANRMNSIEPIYRHTTVKMKYNIQHEKYSSPIVLVRCVLWDQLLYRCLILHCEFVFHRTVTLLEVKITLYGNENDYCLLWSCRRNSVIFMLCDWTKSIRIRWNAMPFCKWRSSRTHRKMNIQSKNHFVWAKMKKFSFWPAKLCDDVPIHIRKFKRSENQICVYFFGSHN